METLIPLLVDPLYRVEVHVVVVVMADDDGVDIGELVECAWGRRVAFGAEEADGAGALGEDGVEEDADATLGARLARRLDEETGVADPCRFEGIRILFAPGWLADLYELFSARDGHEVSLVAEARCEESA